MSCKSILCGGIRSNFSGQQFVIAISRKFLLRSTSASQALETTGVTGRIVGNPKDSALRISPEKSASVELFRSWAHLAEKRAFHSCDYA